MPEGKRSSDAKALISNVYNYFDEIIQKCASRSPLVGRHFLNYTVIKVLLAVYCISIDTTTIKKILKETPGGGSIFSSSAACYEQSQRCVAMDTFDHEAIQPFGGGTAGLGRFRESNYELLGKGDKACQGESGRSLWLCDGLYEDCSTFSSNWVSCFHDKMLLHVDTHILLTV